MLTPTKAITLTANSMINGQQACELSAYLATDGPGDSPLSIQNTELYEANKAECRADMAAFQQLVYDLEDQGKDSDESDVAEGGAE